MTKELVRHLQSFTCSLYSSALTNTKQGISKLLASEMVTSKRVRPLGSIIKAIFYVSKDGIHWLMMPSDLQSWQTLYYYRKWRENGGARLPA